MLNSYPNEVKANSATVTKAIDIYENFFQAYWGDDSGEEDEVEEETIDVDDIGEDDSEIFNLEAPVAESVLNNLDKVAKQIKSKISGYYSYQYPTEEGYVWNGNDWVWGSNQLSNSIFESGNKVFFTFDNDNDEDSNEIQAPYGSSYTFDNFEFSSRAGQPFHAVMWISNNDGQQQSPFKLKVESSPKFTEGEVLKFSGISRGKNKYAGNAFTMHYAVYQVNQPKSSFTPSMSELFYVVTSEDKWESSFSGAMDIDFADDVGETSNSVALPADTENVFFGYSLLAKNKKFQKKDLRRTIRFILRAYSHVDVPGTSKDDAKVNKRDSQKSEWWNWW